MATIVTKNSSTASSVPTTSDLVQGELAVNVTDKRIFTENASTQIVELGTNPSTVTTATATVTGTLTANGTFASSNAVVTGGSVNSTPIGATTPSTVRGTTVTATTGFVGGLTGDVTGNLTGNVTGNVVGNVTGDLTGNVTASSGTSTVNNLVVNGTVDFTNTRLTDVAEPVAGSDAATKTYVDTSIAAVIDGAPAALDTLNELAAALNDDASFHTTVTNSLAGKLPLAGGTMTGQLSLGANKIVSVADPTLAQDVATKAYVDAADTTGLPLAGGTMSGAIAMGTNKITGLGTPTDAADATTKAYTDSILGSATSAAASAAAASTSESNAATSASNASTSETNALNSANAAASSYDQFDDRYLGDKASDPTLDNDGNALLTGALYFNTTTDVMRVYNGSAWQDTAISPNSPTFTGTVTADGLSLGDNDKATFGAGNDLQIYHTGTQSYVSDQGTGNLNLLGDARVVIGKADGTENMAQFFADAQVELYYNNASKLATTATGIDVTGTATMDGLTVDVTDKIDFGGGLGEYASSPTAGVVGFTSRGPVELFTDSNNNGASTGDAFVIYDGAEYGGATKNLLKITKGNDISFYEDTGTTPKFFWDASAESLGIGTTSPNGKTEIASSATGDVLALQLSNSAGAGSDSVSLRFRNSTVSTSTSGGSEITGLRDASGNGGSLVLNTASSVGTMTERMRIDSSGNVGIGTSSPSSYNAVADNLVIGTTSGSNGLTIVAGTGNDGSIHFADGTSGADAYRGQIYYSHAGNYMVFGTNATERMRIDSGGNLLVGNTAPIGTEKLNVNILSGGSAYNSSSMQSSALAWLNNAENDLTKASTLVLRQFNAASAISGLYTGTQNAALTFGTSSSGSSGNVVERMRIDSSGNVGIGTTSPTYQLDLAKNDSNIIRVHNTGTTADAALITTNTAGSGQFGVNATGPYVYTAQANAFQVYTSGSERLRIDSSGNVGIGRTPSSHKLEVSGEIKLANLALGQGIDIYDVGSAQIGIKTPATSVMSFETNNTERMRIDSSGNLLVGQTTTNNPAGANVAGAAIANNGFISVTRDGGFSANFNRKTSDGTIVQFNKDSTTVGSIGTYIGDLFIGTGDAGLWFQDGGNAIRPFRVDTVAGHDNSISLGVASERFKDAHFSGTVNANAFVGDGSGLTGVGGGVWEYIGTYSASSVATHNVEPFSSSYDEYLFIGEMYTSVDYGNLYIRLKFGGSYQTTNYYQAGVSSDSSLGNMYQKNTSAVNGGIMGYSSSDKNHYQLRVKDANVTGYKSLQLQNSGYWTYFDQNDFRSYDTWFQNRNATSALQGIQFSEGNGANISSHSVRVYGLKRS